MHIERRTFLKGTAGVGAAVGFGLFELSEARAEVRELKIARTTETRSICPYCAVACGVIIHTIGDKAKNVTPAVVHVEGDPDHPTNRGTLCPKGSTLRDDINNPRRLMTPKVRRPGSDRPRSHAATRHRPPARNRRQCPHEGAGSLHALEELFDRWEHSAIGIGQSDGLGPEATGQ